MDLAFQIIILIMSVVIHEVAHGYAALALGDQTAKYEGRLTLNPLKHLDPFGSVLLPAISYMLGGFVVGWAKPVPYNPYNLRPGRWSEAQVALAGPVANIFLASVFGLLIRLAGEYLSPAFVSVSAGIILINVTLAVFNLVPVPPLDGSKLLFAFFPDKFPQIRAFFEQYGFVLLIIFILFLWKLLIPVIGFVFQALTGLAI